MGTRQALLEVDPLALPAGHKVGPWRVKSWRGRGAYGTLYCVEHVGREHEGEFALKLAIQPRDERFAHEAELLRRISCPHVPRFLDEGLWQHPHASFPYLVMEWVEGVSLYEWAARRNPTSRQVLRLLAQVARALEATHAADGLHRDVKGDNVLVRAADDRAFLTDFGAGHYQGASTLTSKLLPPGTLAYRTPEAWAFLNAFHRHPTAHYRASTCDDLFALGITAYRLVTDEYPPPTQPGATGYEVWQPGGPGARPVRELNPRVLPELEAIIRRLLAIAPVERFGGHAREAAEALEQAAEKAGPEADALLFSWDTVLRPRCRSPGGARLAAERDIAAREEQARREEEERNRPWLRWARALSRVWARWRNAAATVGLLLTGFILAVQFQALVGTEDASDGASREGGRVAIGDSASTAPTRSTSPPAGGKKRPVAVPMPEQPLPGQNKPPCKKTGEVELRGACWYELARLKPPCKEPGKEDAYAWKGVCYGPSYPAGREPTSSPP